MRIAIGSDHRGVQVKAKLAQLLGQLGHEVLDEGTQDGEQAVDYPDFASAVSRKVSRGEAERGMLVCGTGIGKVQKHRVELVGQPPERLD